MKRFIMNGTIRIAIIGITIFLFTGAGMVVLQEAERNASMNPGIYELYKTLKKRRIKNLKRLKRYRKRGEFPQNTDHPNRRIPYFVDRSGTHCAVGYLMKQDGMGDVIQKIVSTNNHVRVDNVEGGSLLNWIRYSGLTKTEAALIQPSYDHHRRRMRRRNKKRKKKLRKQLTRTRPWKICEKKRLKEHFRKTIKYLNLNNTLKDMPMVRLRDLIEELGFKGKIALVKLSRVHGVAMVAPKKFRIPERFGRESDGTVLVRFRNPKANKTTGWYRVPAGKLIEKPYSNQNRTIFVEIARSYEDLRQFMKTFKKNDPLSRPEGKRVALSR